MKILHTADWHIGKIVNEFSMLEDQVYILEQMFQLMNEEQPDVVIIAGDIYDRSIPPKEAVELLDETLTRIINEYNIPVILISGNHDSSERLGFGNKLLEKGNVFIEGKFNKDVRKVVLDDQFGPVNFYLLPYINPSYARFIYDTDEIKDHHSTMRYIMDKLKGEMNEDERNILVNHNFFSSLNDEAVTSDSERSLSVGGTEVIDAELVKHFDYVALGHLHRPQKIKYDHIRYSGSLLKYSFSEVTSQNGINLIELKEKGTIGIEFKHLKPIRNMIRITGTLEQLTSKAFYEQLNKEDYIHAILTDEKDLYDPLSQLRAIYPNVMQIERANLLHHLQDVKSRDEFKNKTPFDLFSNFYTYITGEEMDESYHEEVKVIMEMLNKGEGINED